MACKLGLLVAMALSVLLAASAMQDMGQQQRVEALLHGANVKNTGGLLSWFAEGNSADKEGEKHRGAIVMKYIVKPGCEEDFVKAWMSHKNKTVEEEKEGLRALSLSKVATDNLRFYGYGEWEGRRAFMHHIESDYTREFLKTLMDLDVGLDITPTMKLTEHSGKDCEAEPTVDTWHTRRWDKKEFSIAAYYMIPPSQYNEWEDMIKDVAKMVGDKESGNRAYAAHKVLTDNYAAVLYGEWDGLDDYWKHLETEHLRRLFEFNQKHGIVWKLEPLITLSKSCPRSSQD